MAASLDSPWACSIGMPCSRRSRILHRKRTIGCVKSDFGTGELIRMMARRVRRATTAGINNFRIDGSNSAQAECALHRRRPSHLQLGNVLAIPWPDEAFDKVYANSQLSALDHSIRGVERSSPRAQIRSRIVAHFERSSEGTFARFGFKTH